MKKDKLEDFIERNRDAFYNDSPLPGGWEHIEKTLTTQKRYPFTRQAMRYAAAAIVIIAVTIAATRYVVLRNISSKAEKLIVSNGKMRMPSLIIIHADKEIPAPITLPSVARDTLSTSPSNDTFTGKSKGIYSDIEEISVFYKSQIYERKNQIIRLASVSGEINRQVDSEIKQMDSLYRSVVRDLKDNINNKEVVEALIMQYRMKLEFLDNILLLIKESEDTSSVIPNVYEK